MPELQPERRKLIRESEALRRRPDFCNDIGADARLDQHDRLVEPFAALLVGIVLRRGCATEIERSIVAGPVALVSVQDVKKRLVAWPEDAVGEIVRMRIAALA